MKKHNFPDNSFIGGWYIPKKICDNIIKYFNTYKNDKADEGRLNDKVYDITAKDSLDMSVGPKNREEPFYSYRHALQKCLNNYVKKYKWANNLERFRINTGYNIQYYKPNGGFKNWHFERQSISSSKRCLVFMTYLNDVEDGGTEFYYQKITTPAKKGLTLIWPTEWTHTHKGQISKLKEKYIVTGWYTFND